MAALGLLSVVALPMAFAAPTPALAYQGCAGTSSVTGSPTVVDGGGSITVTATLRDCNGNGLAGVEVVFAASGPCAASFNPPTAITDANGVATTVATLPTGCPCQYTISATGAGITVTTTVRENGCLPFTAAAPTAAHLPPPVMPVALLVLGAIVVGAGTYLGLSRRRQP